MNTVEPIRDIEKIEQIKVYLRSRSQRNFIMFLLGINSGLRISDILVLKVSDVKNRDFVILSEKKTRKDKKFLLNETLKHELKGFIAFKEDDEYLFSGKRAGDKPLDRTTAYKIINEAARAVGIKDRIGTHTLRKTFGYHFYQKTKDVALLQYLFNHSSPSVTLGYIGINQDVADKALKEFEL